MSDSLQPHGVESTRLLHPYMGFSRQETGVACHFLLQGIFLTQGSNLDLPHYRQMLILSEPPGKSQYDFELDSKLRTRYKCKG